jgi:hypothetical protein
MAASSSQGRERRADVASLTRHPVRISVTIPYSLYEDLVHASHEQGRSISNLAAYLLERGHQVS